MTSGHARIVQASMIVALVSALMWISTTPASAHEERQVGRLTFVVGFAAEPAYSHIPNGVSLSITETASEKPFVDLVDTLDVDVTFGEETTTMTMQPAFVVGVFGTPGEYTADFVPSRPGQYTFHFHGTVGGVEIDEEFVSGPETFNDVEDLSAASFPVQDPSIGELAERLEQENARADDEIAQLNEEIAQMGESESSSDGLARGLSIAALALGAVALGTTLVLVRRRS